MAPRLLGWNSLKPTRSPLVVTHKYQTNANLVLSVQEMWNCPLSLQNLSKYAEDIDAQDSPSISMLSEVAACHEITIIGGSIPEKANGQLFNTCCVLGPDGQVKAKHRKVRIYYFFPSDSEIKKTGILHISLQNHLCHKFFVCMLQRSSFNKNSLFKLGVKQIHERNLLLCESYSNLIGDLCEYHGMYVKKAIFFGSHIQKFRFHWDIHVNC